MLNLTFPFDDAIHALKGYAEYLGVVPLPADVYMMQVDVINQYRHALNHYLNLTLNEKYLQSSSLGTPYQKWAYITNQDFGMLSFAVHNLLRYTSRLVHESEGVAQRGRGRSKESGDRSNAFTSAICELRDGNKKIGLTVHEDHRLSITAVRTERGPERTTARGNAGEKMQHFRVFLDADGTEREQPIGLNEFKRIRETIRSESIDIRDRSQLVILKERGMAEVARLQDRNRTFADACNVFYQLRRVAEPFENYNEEYWI